MALYLAWRNSWFYIPVAGLSLYLIYLLDEVIRSRLTISDDGIGIKHFVSRWIDWSEVQSTSVFGTGLGRFVASVDGVTIKGQSSGRKKQEVSVAYKMFSKEDQAEIKRLIDENLKRHDKGKWAVSGVQDGPLD